MQRAAGFSLIEVLVVIAITSTLAVGATLIWNRGSGEDAAAVAFLREVTLLQRRAMQSGVDHRLVLTATGWRAERQSLGGWAEVPGSQHAARIDRAPQTLMLRADGRTGAARVVFGAASGRSECRTGEGGAPTCAAM